MEDFKNNQRELGPRILPFFDKPSDVGHFQRTKSNSPRFKRVGQTCVWISRFTCCLVVPLVSKGGNLAAGLGC